MPDAILAALVLSAGLVALATQAVAWRRREPGWHRVSLAFMGLGAGLALLALIWRGWTRRHLPPLGGDEAFLGLSVAVAALLIWLQRRRQAGLYSVVSLGVLAVLQMGLINWPLAARPGGEPLAIWGALARWLLLLGFGATGITAALAALRSFAGAGPERARTARLLPPEGLELSQRTRRLALISLSAGLALGGLRLWWGWGGQDSAWFAWPGLVWALLLAAWWLDWAGQPRRWAGALLTVAAFLCALPALLVF